jgi:transcriptional regulator with GAF, ATPase, and Fis domain
MDHEDDVETALVRGETPALPLAARIRVSGAPATPSTFLLSQGSCVVGAGSEADIAIEDSTVSRRHLELALVPEGVLLVDLGSRNGTYYLGQRVERMTLALGSRIRLGSAELSLEVDPTTLSSGGSGPSEYFGLCAASAAMRQLLAALVRLEGSLVNVLVQGESGVGKEVIARALHRGSALAAQAFVPVNCGALARELVASELFGHKRGAFTGALEARQGAFERAHGGTLFLDEVGELPLDIQPLLLRALESGEIRAVGDDDVRHVKVRVVAASNRDLVAEVRAERFREDLYYRLAVVTLEVPPLRERPGDIPVLAAHFAAAEGIAALPQELVHELSSRSWPGNARELRNAVQAFAALGRLPPHVVLRKDDALDRALAQAVDLGRPIADQREEIASRFTRHYLEALLRKTGGNQSEAARLSGMDRGHLGKLIAKLGVGR